MRIFTSALRYSPSSRNQLSGCVGALIFQQKKYLAETSLTLENSYSIRNLCFVNELPQTTINFWDWGSVIPRNLPKIHRIFTVLALRKCFNGSACRVFSNGKNFTKLHKSLQKLRVFCAQISNLKSQIARLGNKLNTRNRRRRIYGLSNSRCGC